jgi:hypothetical protein
VTTTETPAPSDLTERIRAEVQVLRAAWGSEPPFGPCYFCGRLIWHKPKNRRGDGIDEDGDFLVAFHLDGDLRNMDPETIAPAHKHCARRALANEPAPRKAPPPPPPPDMDAALARLVSSNERRRGHTRHGSGKRGRRR